STDTRGNIASEMFRIQVSTDVLDADAVFSHFGTVASVGEAPGEAGISVSTDLAIEDAYIKYVRLPNGFFDFGGDEQIARADMSQVFEVLRETGTANPALSDAQNFQNSLSSQPLRSHEFMLGGLEPGQRYEYWLGTSST